MSGEARPAGRPDAGPGRRRRGRRGPAAGGAGGPGRARPAWRRGAASAGPAEAPSPRGVPGRVAPGAPGRAAGPSPPRPRDRAGRTCGRSAPPPGPRLSRSGRPRLQAAARVSLWRGRRPLSPRFVPVVPSAALRPRGAARPRLAGSSGPNPEPPAPRVGNVHGRTGPSAGLAGRSCRAWDVSWTERNPVCLESGSLLPTTRESRGDSGARLQAAL